MDADPACRAYRPELAFVLPATIAGAMTGGNLYDAGLAAGLEQLLGRPPQTLTPSEARARLARGTPMVLLVDSLALASLPDLRASCSTGQSLICLGHSLPSLLADVDDPRLESARADEARQLACADAIVAPSDLAADTFRAIVASTPVWSFAPAIDLDPPPRSVAREGVAKLLMIANLLPGKRVLELLETLAEQLRAEDRFRFEIVGHRDLDPDYAAACRHVIETNIVLCPVHLVGACPRSHVRDALIEADMLVSASRYETFGMAVQEARAFGVAIAAIPAGNIRNQLATGAGRSCADLRELAQVIVELIRDERVRARIRRQRSPRWDMFDRTWVEIARELLERIATNK